MAKRSNNPETRARQNAKRHAKRKARMKMDPIYRKAHYRRKTLARYSLTPADYAALQLAQHNACGICGLEPMPEDNALAVDCDHDQEPLVVRGLLCMKCNTAIGKLNHDPRLLLRAIDWLNGVR